jgi:hypothetical protein
MPTRKAKTTEAAKPAFVVADASNTDFLGLTKIEAFAAVVAMGIFAGPSGRVILDSNDDSMLERVAETSFRMGAVMAAHAAKLAKSGGAA